MFKIGKYEINITKPVYIIAEAGINHNGDIRIAKEMIKKASECGANAIKFQTFFPEELFSELLNAELFELAKKWSFTKHKENLELKKHANRYDIEFLLTPLGKKSINLLKKVGVKAIKIASGELTNYELIKTASNLGLPLIMSTGMSTIPEIKSAVQIAQSNDCPFALLHCNSSYPTPLKEANISTIPFFQKLFNVPIGYSDHTIGIEACLAAVSLGACIIEKHFTLDKKMKGPDQKLSANPKEFLTLVSHIRKLEKTLGTRRKGPTKSEKKFKKIMRKSIGALIDIPKGTKIKKSMLTAFRPGTGIPPFMIDKMIGMTTKKNIKKDTLLEWDFL